MAYRKSFSRWDRHAETVDIYGMKITSLESDARGLAIEFRATARGRTEIVSILLVDPRNYFGRGLCVGVIARPKQFSQMLLFQSDPIQEEQGPCDNQ